MYLTRAAQVYEERYFENHQRENNALLWTQTQPAFTARQKTKRQYDYGHGVYLLNLTITVAELRTDANQVKNPVRTVNKLIEELDADLLVQRLEISEDSFEERRQLLIDAEIADLPSGSVRALYLQLLNFKRRQSELSSYSPKFQQVAKRIIRAIRCGITVIKNEVNDKTGELIPAIQDVFFCKNKRCANPICHSHHATKRRISTQRELNEISATAAQNDLIPVIITLKTPWALPRQERRHAPATPTLHTLGRGKQTLIRPEPLDKKSQNNLLEYRLDLHEKHRTKFIRSAKLRKACASKAQYTTEFSFLTPSTEGHRTFPNPHTHIVSSISRDTCIPDLATQLSKTFKQITKLAGAQVLISRLYSDSDNASLASLTKDNKDNKNEETSKYLDKEVSITPDEGTHKPQAFEVSSSLCSRSLMELIDLDDFGKTRKLKDSFLYEKQRCALKLNKLNKLKTSVSKPSGSAILDPKLTLLKEGEYTDPYASLNRWAEIQKGSECLPKAEGECLRFDYLEGERSKPDEAGVEVPEPVELGGLDDDSGPELGEVCRTPEVAKPVVSPLRRLWRKLRNNLRLSDLDDGDSCGIISTGNVDSDINQGTGPARRVQEDDDGFISTDEDVGLIENDLVENAFVARKERYGSGKLRRLGFIVQADNDLYCADGVSGKVRHKLGMNAEGGFAGAFIAGAKGRVDSRVYVDGKGRVIEIEKVPAVQAKKTGAGIALDDQISAEIYGECLRRGEGRTQSDRQSVSTNVFADEQWIV